jgi:DNA-binding NarL/FixJ family response regulator
VSINILIADDHQVVRSGLACLLEGTDIEIVAEAANSDEAVAGTLEHQPDVVLLDIRMGDQDGLTALKSIREQSPDSRVVMLSMYDNPTYVARAVALGACDYVLKGAPRETLITALNKAAAGESPAAESVLQHIKDAMGKRQEVKNPDIPLTNREMQVLRHVALGLRNREIGHSLGISIETVKEHVQNILRKIDATDRTQAAVWAVKKSLV